MYIIHSFADKIYELAKDSKIKAFLYLVIISFLLFGIVLRFQHLNKTFWLDEWLTIEKIATIFEDHTANPYHLLNYFGIKIFGINELYLRLFSVFFGLLTIGSIYIISAYFFGKLAGIISAALYSIFPYSVILGQEVRMYSLLSFFSVIHLYFILNINLLILYGKKVSKKIYGYYFISIILVLFTHFTAAILIFTEVLTYSLLYFIYNRKINYKNLFIINIFGLTLFGIWDFKHILVKLGFFIDSNTYIEKFASSGNFLKDVLISLFNITIGFAFFSVVAVFVCFAILLLCILKVKINYKKKVFKSQEFLLILSICITTFLYLITNYILGTFVPRHFFVVAAYIAMLLGFSLSLLIKRNFLLGSLVTFILLFTSLVNSVVLQTKDVSDSSRKWPAVAQYVKGMEENKNLYLLVSVPYVDDLFRYYYDGNLPILRKIDYKNKSQNELIRKDEIGVSFFNEDIVSEIIEKAKDKPRLLLINSEGDLILSDNQGLLKKSLEREFQMENEKCFPDDAKGLCVISYTKRIN